MRVNLIRIGNSRGIIIPSSILSACNLKDAAELQVDDGKITIEPLKHPRTGWFDNVHPETEPGLLDDIPLDEDDGEWTW